MRPARAAEDPGHTSWIDCTASHGSVECGYGSTVLCSLWWPRQHLRWRSVRRQCVPSLLLREMASAPSTPRPALSCLPALLPCLKAHGVHVSCMGCSDCSQWQGTCQCVPNFCDDDTGLLFGIIGAAMVALVFGVMAYICYKRRQQWISERKSAALLDHNHGPAAGAYSSSQYSQYSQHQPAAVGYHQQAHYQMPQTTIPVAVAVAQPQPPQQSPHAQQGAPPPQLDASVAISVAPPRTGGGQQRSASKRFDCVFSNKTNCDALCLEVRTQLEARNPPVTVWQQKTNIPKGAIEVSQCQSATIRHFTAVR